MPPAIPWYITLIVVTTNVAIALIVWSILASATNRSGLAPTARRALRTGSAILLAAWLAAAFLLAPALGSLVGERPAVPPVALFSTAVLVVALLASWLSPSVRRVLAAVSVPTLIGVQVYRVIGAAFLVLLAQGKLPAHFALPAGWGDVAIGLAAPLVALAVARGMRGAPALAISWNALGLLDLVVAVGMGTGLLVPLLAPGLGRVAPAVAMQAFPMVLVPAFAVPLSVLLHLLALRGVLREVRLGSGLIARTAR
jgi:hypothetical protein